MGNVLDCSADTQKEDDLGDYARQHGVPANTRPSSVDSPDVHFLEENVPLRDSKLWNVQRWYYEKFGTECWESMVVPSFVTSNAFIATQTARVIAGYIRDSLGAQKKCSKEPVYIIEIGSGHGKFSFLVLQALFEMCDYLPELCEEDQVDDPAASELDSQVGANRKPAFMYIVTDVSQKALDAIASHPAMQKFIDIGILELALFDAEKPVSSKKFEPLIFTLQPSGDTLNFSAGSSDGTGDELAPLFICNYVLDSLIQDAFLIEGGSLYENRVTVQALSGSNSEGSPLAHLENFDSMTVKAMDSIQITWSHSDYPVKMSQLATYYGERADSSRVTCGAAGDEEFNFLLKDYMNISLEEFKNDGASILMPIGGLRLIKRLQQELPKGRFTLLVGDKGYGCAGEMKGCRDPHIATHGSFSCMVNLDALVRFAEKKGAACMGTPYQEGFKCHAFCFGMENGFSALPEFSMAWQDAFSIFGPESFSALQRAVKDEVPDASLKHITSLLRLSSGDPDVFFKFKAALVQHVSNTDLSPSQWTDLREDVSQVAGNNYHLQVAKDVSFEAGRLLMAMKDFKAALQLFSHSKATCGDHPATLLNMGMSTFCSGEYLAARDLFRRCVAINPSYEDGLQWLAHTERVISSGTGGSNSSLTSNSYSVANGVDRNHIDEQEASETYDS